MSRIIEANSKELSEINGVQIVGKVMSMDINTGKNSSGVAYQSVRLIVRVEQDYNGIHEISDIPVKAYASQYTKAGTVNPAWESIDKMKSLKTADNVGIDEADMIRIGKSGSLRESTYFSTKLGKVVDGWEVNSSFFSLGTNADNEYATFKVDAFILDIRDELDYSGEETGRLIVKAGVIGYGPSLNVFEFIAESDEHVRTIRSTWSPNDTVRIGGRVRVANVNRFAASEPADDDGWGEAEIQVASPKKVYELIITSGKNPYSDDNAYDPDDIKPLVNARKANLMAATAPKTAAPAAAKPSRREWNV